jgi:lambda family phage minor tail protein L
MAEGRDKAARELMSLQPGSLLSLYRLYPDYISKPNYFFDVHDGSVFGRGVVWQGLTYQPMGIEAEGFETNANGRLNRPKMRISNNDYFVTNIAQNNNDLKNAKVIRKRVFVKFLDDINFDGGNPFGEADASAELFNEEYLVSQKIQENKNFVELELTSPLDLDEFEVNNRRIFARYCYWKYRGEGCGYQGPPKQKADGTPFVDTQENTLGVIGGGELDFEYGNYEDLYDPIRAYLKGEIAFKENNRVTIADPNGIEDPKPMLTYYVARENISGFDPEKNPKFWERDGCNKKVSSCKLRFYDPYTEDLFLPSKRIDHRLYQFTGQANTALQEGGTDQPRRQAGLLLRRPLGSEDIDPGSLPPGPGDLFVIPPRDVLRNYSFDSDSADDLASAINGSQDFTLMLVLKIQEQGANDYKNGILQTTWNLYDGLRLSFERFDNDSKLSIVMHYTSKDVSNNYINRKDVITSIYNLETESEIPLFIENDGGDLKAYLPNFQSNGYETPVFSTSLNTLGQQLVIDYHELGLGILPGPRFYDQSDGLETSPSYNYRAYKYTNLEIESPATQPSDPWADFYSNFEGLYSSTITTRGYETDRDSNGNYVRPYIDGVGDGLLAKQNEYAVYSGGNGGNSYIYFNKDITGWVFSIGDYGLDDNVNDKYIVNYTGLHDLANLGDPNNLLSPGDNHIMEYDTNQPDRRGAFVFDPTNNSFFVDGSGVKGGVFSTKDYGKRGALIPFSGGLENPYSGVQTKRFPASSHLYNVIPQAYGWEEPKTVFSNTAIWRRKLTATEKKEVLFFDLKGSINTKPISIITNDYPDLLTDLVGYWDAGICYSPELKYGSESVPRYCSTDDCLTNPGCEYNVDVQGGGTYKVGYSAQFSEGFCSEGYVDIDILGTTECFKVFSTDPSGNVALEDEIPANINNFCFLQPPQFGPGPGIYTLNIQLDVDGVVQQPADYCTDNGVEPWESPQELIVSLEKSDGLPVSVYGTYESADGQITAEISNQQAQAALSSNCPGDIGDLYPNINPPVGFYLCGWDIESTIISNPPEKFVCNSFIAGPEENNYKMWHTDMFYDMCLKDSTSLKNKLISKTQDSYSLPFGGFPGTDPFQFRTKL